MHIDRRLNIVGEFARGEDPPLVFHSTALPEDVFELYFDLFGRTMNRLMTDGYGRVAPRYAASVLRQVALDSIPSVLEKGTEAYEKAKAIIEARLAALFNELHRLTFVMAMKNGRWETMPIDDAKAAGAVTDKEVKRIDATIVFSISASESVPPEDAEGILGGLALFNARIESLSCSEFVSSFQTSMKGGNSGAKAGASPASSNGSPQTQASGSTSNGSTNPASHGAHPRRTGIAISVQP